MAWGSGKDDAAQAAKHIQTLAKAVAKSARDKVEAEKIWSASKGKGK